MMKPFLTTFWVLLAVAAIGCGDALPPAPPADAPAIIVVYQSDPIADVHVQLHDSAGGKIVARAITSVDGKARFVNLPSPEPTEYFVSLQSVSDGGWILDQESMHAFTQSLRLKPLAQNPPQSIELPPRSVKPLHLNNR